MPTFQQDQTMNWTGFPDVLGPLILSRWDFFQHDWNRKGEHTVYLF